jgi:hypothetical protein
VESVPLEIRSRRQSHRNLAMDRELLH